MEQKEINQKNMKYIKDNYYTLKVYLPKEYQAKLKAEAVKRGLSVNALLNLLIAQILPPDPPAPSGEIPEDAEQEPTAPTGAETDTEPED